MRIYKSVSATWHRAVRAPLAILLSLLALVQARADVPAQYRDIVAAMGRFATNGQADLSHRFFDAVGFGREHRASVPEWEKKSIISKLDYLYWHAETAKKGSGKTAIAEFARAQIDVHPTLADVPEVKRLLSTIPRAIDPLAFAKPTVRGPPPQIPAELAEVVTKISRYAGDPSYLSAELLLRKAGFTSKQIYKAARSANTIEEIIITGISDLDPQMRRLKLRMMAEATVEHYPGAKADKHISEFIASTEPEFVIPKPRPDPVVRPPNGPEETRPSKKGYKRRPPPGNGNSCLRHGLNQIIENALAR